MTATPTKLSREHKRIALDAARLDYWCDEDPWGWCMSHHFAVAEVLYHAGAEIPAHWRYAHPMGRDAACNPIAWGVSHWDEEGGCAHSYPETEYVPFLDAGELGIAMLQYVGNVMGRYANRVKRPGKDY